MSIIKSIIEKLKLRELSGMIFIAAMIITFIPNEWAEKMKVASFRNDYQTYISLCLIIIGAYYILNIIERIKKTIWNKTHSWKKMGIKYMKENMSPDEMALLVETFYDEINKCFRSSGKILYSDGRKTPLANMHIIYLSSTLGDMLDGFSYNLQPYVLDFLNKNLKEGNIKIIENHLEYKLK